MLAELELDFEETRTLLVQCIRNEVYRTGLKNAVIGLSGGVDSAVAAYLAVQALGAEHVFCVLMPYKTSGRDSITDAESVVAQIGCRSERVEITGMADALIATEPDMSNVRRGNIMARSRMIVLYDRSVKYSALVIGTGNKTEILLGYTTLFGDSASAVNPLGDLYKSQIWKLAKHLGVPKQIVEKAPSADLWSGQTDEGELGFSYKAVDQLLHYLVDERRAISELLSLGFEEHFIRKVQRMIVRCQYKRVPPVIARVGARTINADFRYPRDWMS